MIFFILIVTHRIKSEPDGRVCLVVLLYAMCHQCSHFLHVVLWPVQVRGNVVLGTVTAGVGEGVSRRDQAAVLFHEVTEDRLVSPIHQTNLEHSQSGLSTIYYTKLQRLYVCAYECVRACVCVCV